MKTYLTVFFFFLCNAIGFNIGPILYIVVLKYKLVDINVNDFNPAGLQYDMITMPLLVWFICALFSFSIFFLHGIWRKVFLFAPIVMPFLYGIASLQSYP